MYHSRISTQEKSFPGLQSGKALNITSLQTMKYFSIIGDFLTAYQFCLKNGGQLFSGNGRDTASVCVVGSNCYTFWDINSKRKQQVEELATYFNLDPTAQTGGRIARWLIEELICIPYEKTFWSRTYRNLAKSGSHWHYLHCDSKTQFYGIEVDIKSAYFSSLFSFPSLLYQPEVGYLDDNGAMENLKELYKVFPKWFRLQLLGCMSTWRSFYYCRDKKQPDSKELMMKSRYFIKYNAAFNVAHRAILRNYKIMARIHQIGGKYIRRIHTDSFFIDIDIPVEIESQIWQYIQGKNLQYSVKGFGSCFFWDVNTGFIGNKFVGASIDVMARMRADEIRMKSRKTNAQIFENPSLLLATATNYADLRDDAISNLSRTDTRLELFPMATYSESNYFVEH